MRIVIIGSGPTGLGAAYRLAQIGAFKNYNQVFILEKGETCGGLASTVKDDKGFYWDLGGHVLFSHYSYFDKMLDDNIAWKRIIRQSYVVIWDNDKPRYVPYPIQNNLRYLSENDKERCLEGLKNVQSTKQTNNFGQFTQNNLPHLSENVKEQCLESTKQINNFGQWIKSKFGQGLYDIFMQPYNRKVWTVEPEKMNIDWVGERVAVPSYTEALAQIKDNTTSTGWGPNAKFMFPVKGGTGALWSSLANKLPPSWIKYKMNVYRTNIKDKYVEVETDDSSVFTINYDVLISTMPINQLLQNNKNNDVASEHIASLSKSFIYNSVHIVGVGMKGECPDHLRDKTWLYFSSNDIPFYRITIFSNYSISNTPKGCWSLLCEAAEKVGDNSKVNKEEILASTVSSLIKYGLIENKDNIISTYHQHLPYGYPVPFLGRDDKLKTINSWLESNHVYSRGRFGGWKYEVSNQDHCFMQGVEIADRVISGIPESTYYYPKIVNNPKLIKNVGRYASNMSNYPTPEVTYVVSHYSEDLQWLEKWKISNKCHVYHKGDSDIPLLNVWQWQKLPNVGRESHTYLKYIIDHYNNLPDVVVFLQGRIDDHSKVYSNPRFYHFMAENNGIAFAYLETYNNWGRIKHISPWKEKIENGVMKKASLDFGQFYNKLMKVEHPHSIQINYHACFGVEKSRILRRSLGFYLEAISYVNDHPDPENGHYFERLWYSIFTTG